MDGQYVVFESKGWPGVLSSSGYIISKALVSQTSL